MKKTLLTQLKAFKEKLGKMGFPVKRMILFGSHARGDALRESDVDLLIISQAFGKISVPRRRMLLEESWKNKEPIETLPYTSEEFERVKKTSYTVADALRYGITI